MASLSQSYFGRPQVTSTASCVVKRRPTCIDHLGIQVESREELSELAGRLKTAGAVTVDQADASCCYAKSDKSWVKDPSGVSWETFFTFGAATVYGEDTIEDERAAYSTSGISKSFLVKNSTRPVATAAGFLPGKSWLAHGIDTVSISGIHCCSRSAPSKNTGNVSLPRIDSTGCRISFRPSVEIFQCCMAPSST